MAKHAWVYNDRLWPGLRRTVFHRDGHTCQHCNKLVLHGVPATHPFKGVVDHIVPIEKDPSRAFDPDNLQTLHKQCHDGWKQRQDKGRRLQRSDGW